MVNPENHKTFLAALTAFTILQIAVMALRWDRALVWDSSVYVGMGKNLFTLGKIGFWEFFRPPAIPVFIGAIWKTGLFFPNLARIIAITVSITGLTAIYQITEKEFNREIALYTALILMASSVFIKWSHYLLTGILAAILVFTAIYYAKNRKPVKSGVIAALAFLTRFPAALAAPAAGITLMLALMPLKDWFKPGKIRENFSTILEYGVKMVSSFTLPVLIYFTLNHFYGKGFLSPIIAGASVPTLNPDKYFYGLYFFREAVVTNPLLIFLPLGIYHAVKNREKEIYGYVIGLTIFYGFFTFYPHKLPRFQLLFLPLMALVAARGINGLEVPFSLPDAVTKQRMVLSLLVVVFVFNAAHVVNMNTWSNDARNSYMEETAKLNGTVAGLNPAPVVYGDFKFMALRPEHYEKTMVRVFRNADYFTLDTCSWYCAPAIDRCQEKKNNLIQKLETRKKIFETSNRRCRYAIYKVN